MKALKRESRWRGALIERSDGKCEYCGRDGCDPAHIIPRGRRRTSFILENGLYLCRPCHINFDLSRKSFTLLVRVLITTTRYEMLKLVRDGKMTVEEACFTEIK